MIMWVFTLTFWFFSPRGNSQALNVLNSPSTWPKNGPGEVEVVKVRISLT
jgi:hypothetical protein